MTTRKDVENAFDHVVESFTSGKTPSPGIVSPKDINDGFAAHAVTVAYEYLGEPDDVTILALESDGTLHFWLELNGWHFDAETPRGRDGYQNLSFFQRNIIPPEDPQPLTDLLDSLGPRVGNTPGEAVN